MQIKYNYKKIIINSWISVLNPRSFKIIFLMQVIVFAFSTISWIYSITFYFKYFIWRILYNFLAFYKIPK